MQALSRCAELLQSQHGHVRAQVRAADADVHHIGDGLMSTHRVGIGQHGIQRGVHLGQLVCNVWPVAGQRQAPGAAQQRVQHGAAFGAVDGLAAKHGVAVPGESTGTGHVQQQRFGGGVPQVLGKVRKHLGRMLAEVLKALRIAGKGLPQVQTAAICGERGLQLRPLRSLVATEGGHGGFRMWGGENRRDSNLITQFI
ncbi:hypothetical protein D3C71_1021500 [compost metagenome]